MSLATLPAELHVRARFCQEYGRAPHDEVELDLFRRLDILEAMTIAPAWTPAQEA